MPWEKSFDIDEAVDRATEVFWAKGYDSSSLSDLIKATGVNKGSFYNAFGSKKKLFIQTLLKYEREHRKEILATYSALADPLYAIAKLFDELIAQSLTDTEKKGCFLVNTALDLPNHDAEVQDLVKKGLKETEAFFAEQLQLGQKLGVVSERVDPTREAKGLLSLLIGLRVLARGVYDHEDLTAIKAQAMHLIQKS